MKKKRLYCFKHKKENMVVVVHNKCIIQGCVKTTNI